MPLFWQPCLHSALARNTQEFRVGECDKDFREGFGTNSSAKKGVIGDLGLILASNASVQNSPG